MHTWRRPFLALALVFSCATSLAAQSPTIDTVTIAERGTFKAKLVDKVPRAGDPSGYANSLTGHQLIEKTTEICARLGVRFGITLLLEGKPAGGSVLLQIVNNYPVQGIINDKGQKFERTRFPWLTTFGQPTSIVFTFDEPWEMVHGTWKFEIEYNGRKIGEQAFTIMTTCETS